MGTLSPFSRVSPRNPEVFVPVNYRPTERCRTLAFDRTDGNDYQKRFDAVGVQYALGEQYPTGYHMVEYPDSDGPFIRYIEKRPDGSIYAREHKAHAEGDLYPPDELRVVGFIFQFIRNFETGERWELIRGPAYPDGGESMEQPIYDVLG